MAVIDIFTEIFNDEPNGKYEEGGKKTVPYTVYRTVDITDNEPVAVIEPDFDRGPWIAGGACLRWYQGQPVGENDIDVFCANAKQAADVIARIKSYGRYTVKFESENAVTLQYRSEHYGNCVGADQWIIQVITKRYYSSVREIVDNFDLSVCQLGTAGFDWTLGEHTARDIREKNLRMNIPLQPDAVKRLSKYWTYGYRPVPNLLDAIINNPTGKWEFNPSEDYS
jgi:hypothetical protein